MKSVRSKMARKVMVFLTVTAILFLGFTAWAADQPRAKNLIVLIVDGCSTEQYTLARWYKGEPLALDEILVGALKTYIADSVIADSAPAASAFATGQISDPKLGLEWAACEQQKILYESGRSDIKPPRSCRDVRLK